MSDAEAPAVADTVDTEVPASPRGDDGPPSVDRDVHAFRPLGDAPAFGDPGAQGLIVPVAGPLTPGVPDTIVDFFTAEPFEFRAVSTRGMSHRLMGIPRQDSCAAAVSDRWFACAVADGVSQAESSHMAAETAARAAVRLAVTSGADIDWDRLAGRVSWQIAREAVHRQFADEETYKRLAAEKDTGREIGAFYRDIRRRMATTLVVAIVRRDANVDGDHLGEVAVLAGDSGAFQVAAGVMAPIAGGKDADAAIASTSVRPLPGPSCPEVVNVTIREGGALLLVSDGIGDPLGDADNELGIELGRRWATPPTADALVRDVNFLRRSFDDDRTLAGIWLLPPRALRPSRPEEPEPAERSTPTRAETGPEADRNADGDIVDEAGGRVDDRFGSDAPWPERPGAQR